jgi:hypothetical protein
MKYRTGFVSNSSSTSFTCCICGNTESGMDLCLSDAQMCECEHGHIMCNSEVSEFVKKKKLENEWEER